MKVRVMGIDPGYRCSGWGIICWSGHHVSYEAGGLIVPDARLTAPQRLAHLYQEFWQRIDTHRPDVVSLEETFVREDHPKSSLSLGQARGAIMAAVGAHELNIVSYAPNAIKKALTGYGHSDKQSMMKMVKMILPQVPSEEKSDLYDALAVALCHGHCSQLVGVRES